MPKRVMFTRLLQYQPGIANTAPAIMDELSRVIQDESSRDISADGVVELAPMYTAGRRGLAFLGLTNSSGIKTG